MKKFLFSFLTPLLVSLFLFPNLVKADTINVYLNNSSFNPFDSLSNLDTIRSNVDTFISSNNLINRYIIHYYGNVNKYYLTIFKSNYDSHRQYTYYRTNGLYINMSQELCYNINSDFTIGSSYTCDYTYQYIYQDYNTNTLHFLLYSNFYFTPDSSLVNNNVSAITYNYDTYSYTADTSHLLTLSELQEVWFPNDDTPLLTQFIDISIEKLGLICDFITSSYIYLSIFVVFIIYFTILLLRRFK